MSDPIARPSLDAWVGVDLEVLRFVQSLEVQLNNLSVRLETIEFEHREALSSDPPSALKLEPKPKGKRSRGGQHWLWVVATAAVTAHEVAMSRSQTVAKRLLGAFVRGTVVTDRYSSYRYMEQDRRQLCWAHLYRDFVRIGERNGEAGRIGRKLERLAEKLFGLWERRRARRLRPEVWESETALRFRMRGLLERGARLGMSAEEKQG